MDTCDVVIVIPIYKVNLKWYEQLSLERVVTILGKYHIAVCCPENLDLSLLESKYGITRIERFDDKYFTGIDAYNHLMMSCEFYERFLSFKYMLIYQLDAFVFLDRLQYFCSLGYDYIGAPWMQPTGIFEFRGQSYRLKVGNGGLSLRKIGACLYVLKKYKDIVIEWDQNEDSFFSYCGYWLPEEFCVAPFSVAKDFSIEAAVSRLYKKNKYKIPFGCHAWMRFGGECYPQLFKKVGVNIDKYKPVLGYEDTKYIASRFKHRLYVNIVRTKSFSGILPHNDCWSIVCFGKIGKKLAESFLRDGIDIKSIYDSKFNENSGSFNEFKFLRFSNLEDMKCEKGKIIIATINCEKELIEKFEEDGWKYGVDFISLGREYAKRFKNLGYEKYLYLCK